MMVICKYVFHYKKTLVLIFTFLNSNIFQTNSLECISMNNQECKAKPKIVNTNNNANDPIFYPYSFKVKKCNESCNNINNPYDKLCIPDNIKKLNVKGFNLVSRINETRQMLWHETRKCVCKLSVAVYNNKQIWNDNRCR